MKTLAEKQREREEQQARDTQTCLEMLMKAVKDRSMVLSGDYRVSECDAAILLGFQPNTLKNMRSRGQAPAHYLRGVGGGRVSYRLHALAVWIEAERQDY